MQDLQSQVVTKYLARIICTSYWGDDPWWLDPPPATEELVTAIHPHRALQQPAPAKQQGGTFCKMNLDKAAGNWVYKSVNICRALQFLKCLAFQLRGTSLVWTETGQWKFSVVTYIWLTAKFAVTNWRDDEFLDQGGRLALTPWKKSMKQGNVFWFSQSLRIPEISKAPGGAPVASEGMPAPQHRTQAPSTLPASQQQALLGQGEGTGGALPLKTLINRDSTTRRLCAKG